ncbi:MAG: hypothetical protein FWG80_05045 [Alphaproteobacteria bacterium]|nr:hypothetical protein [Alphaproteobacteria bacterium]
MKSALKKRKLDSAEKVILKEFAPIVTGYIIEKFAEKTHLIPDDLRLWQIKTPATQEIAEWLVEQLHIFCKKKKDICSAPSYTLGICKAGATYLSRYLVRLDKSKTCAATVNEIIESFTDLIYKSDKNHPLIIRRKAPGCRIIRNSEHSHPDRLTSITTKKNGQSCVMMYAYIQTQRFR